MLKLAALSFVAVASALTLPRGTCSFELTASGPTSGTLGQLPDGQVRIGGGYPASKFIIVHGGITDAAGRGCILTPSVEQFQCDQGVTPAGGFSIDSKNTLLSSGNSKFFACPASETEWNVYTTPVIGQAKCVEIKLTASDCSTPAPPVHTTIPYLGPITVTATVTVTQTYCPVVTPTIPPPSESSAPPTLPPTSKTTIVETSSIPTGPGHTSTTTIVETSTVPTSPPYTKSTSVITSSATVPHGTGTAPGYPTVQPTAPYWHNTTRPAPPPTKPTSTYVAPPASCPTTLVGSPDSGNWQFPHLIVPISSSTPNTAAGTSYFGTVSPKTSSIFNFDIPYSYAGKTCSLVFLLPHHADLETSAYTLSGSGAVDFEKLSSVATQATTYNNAPAVASDLGTFTLTEGSSTVVSTFACPAGNAVAFEAKAVGNTDLYYFQDYNPSPLGLYITTC